MNFLIFTNKNVWTMKKWGIYLGLTLDCSDYQPRAALKVGNIVMDKNYGDWDVQRVRPDH